MSIRIHRGLTAIAVVGAVSLPLAACGDDGGTAASAGTPKLCQDKAQLDESISSLSDVEALRSGSETLGDAADTVQAQLQDVERDAKALVSSAQRQFPDEAQSIDSAVHTLQRSIQGLPDSPSAQDLASLGLQATTAVNAVKSFEQAAAGTC